MPEPEPEPDTVIEDEPEILTDFEEEEELIDEVPLAEAPPTGDTLTMAIAAIVALLTISGIVLLITTKKREN